MRPGSAAAALLALTASVAGAQANPFTYLDPAYSAKIIANGSSGNAGIAFWNGKVLRNDGSSTLYVLDPSSTVGYHGDNLYTVSTLAVDRSIGWGMVTGSDGYLYAQTGSGIAKVDLGTGTSSILPGSVGGTFGMKQTSTGKIAYNGGDGWVHLYDLGASTDAAVYNSGTFNDDLAVGPGNIFVAALGDCTIRVLDNSGNYVNTITSAGGHCADGVAYGLGDVFANNTDDYITRYAFSGGFGGTFTESVFAYGKAGYQDFAAAGPDGAFYVTRDCQTYTDGFSDCGRNVVRISLAEGGGGFSDGVTTPEPATLALFATGFVGLAGRLRRRRDA